MTAGGPVLDGRYRLGPLIGRGGMSDVYRARDQRTGTQVAVKILRSNDATLAARLAREARALQQVHHANLVQVLDSGVIDTRAYLVMTYVDGSTLEARLRGGPLAPGAAASLGAEMASALAYIHARGMVHRDVKPANILVTAGGQVKLADFGIASLADASALTITGSTLGTVAYMAPEQLEHHRVGPNADTWSLGMVLLECLTGRRLYTGAPSEVIARRLAQPVPIPSDLPAAWQTLLSGMLAQSPAARPPAQDVARQLRGPAFAAPWDPWGQPLVPAGPTTVPLTGTAADGRDRTEVAGTSRPPADTKSPAFRWHRAALAGLAALAAAGLVIFALGEGSNSGRRTGAQVTATSSPRSNPVVPTAASRLSILTRDVNAGVAAGSLANAAGDAVTNDARQAISAAAAGNRGGAATDIQRALRTVSAGVQDGSVTSREAQLLQADLSALAASLGVSAISTAPSTAPPTQPTQPSQPAPHGHHGNGEGGGDNSD
jgi:serine/threonine protein kinase